MLIYFSISEIVYNSNMPGFVEYILLVRNVASISTAIELTVVYSRLCTFPHSILKCLRWKFKLFGFSLPNTSARPWQWIKWESRSNLICVCLPLSLDSLSFVNEMWSTLYTFCTVFVALWKLFPLGTTNVKFLWRKMLWCFHTSILWNLTLKTADTIGNCQRLVFTVGVSQQMHKIINLWKI